jgi:hypothetical protein
VNPGFGDGDSVLPSFSESRNSLENAFLIGFLIFAQMQRLPKGVVFFFFFNKQQEDL